MDRSSKREGLVLLLLIIFFTNRGFGVAGETSNDRGEGKRRRSQIVVPRRISADTNGGGFHHFLSFAQQSGDEEMRYNLTAFGKVYKFVLRPKRNFISPSFNVEHYTTANLTKPIPTGVDLSHCFYRGTICNDTTSSAAFDLCGGMRGAFKTRDGVFLIEPLVKNKLGDDNAGSADKPHLITNYLATSSPIRERVHLENDTERTQSNSEKTQKSSSRPNEVVRRRRKRDAIFQGTRSYPRYLETMVTVDKSMVDHYGSEFEVKRYIQTIMNVVHNMFRDVNIGNSIDVVLTGIKILKNEEDLRITNDANKLLRNFCAWQHKQNVISDSEAGHYDTAILITRKDICKTKGHCDTLGLAELGTVCEPSRSCSIIEDSGLATSFTVAHELGHVFNLGHDTPTKNCQGEVGGMHVMAPSMNLQALPWTWSSCSRHEITEFLEGGHDSCLMDKPQYQFKFSEQLPGEVYSPTMQCKLVYGKDSSLCTFQTNKCRRLWCTVKVFRNIEGCKSQSMPWADGSSCGQGKWCIHGECVEKRTKTVINGNWSPWSPFGPCSRTCGGGVTFSSRSCNNPRPSNGGKFCFGAKTRFKSCNTKDCPKGSASFRAVQCAKYNNRRGPPGSQWVPRYLRGRHRCQLFCERIGGGGVIVTPKVVDGTKCGKNVFDICVNGICRLAGCDNVLNSQKKVDVCGVCGGRNDTCERTYNSWHKKVKWGYNDVTTFPSGISSVKIELRTPKFQGEWDRTSNRTRGKLDDYNYLALLDEKYRNILNGGYHVKGKSANIFHISGLKITYSGAETYPEYIIIEGKLQQKIRLQVLAIKRVISPTITYSFLRPIVKRNVFYWDNRGPWRKCSRQCQGSRKRELLCKRGGDNSSVSSKFCKGIEKPEKIEEVCNGNCVFKWMITSKGACKPGCGPSTQKLYYRCVKHFVSSGANLIHPSRDCERVTRPPNREKCEGSCDNVVWAYSRWSKCSKSCNGGIQRRSVVCLEKNAKIRKELPVAMCARIEKRPETRSCNTMRCPAWRAGEWSRCSAACGEGNQRRKVQCVMNGNRQTSPERCDSRRKPSDERSCRIKACPHWEYEEWSDCSATCGSGHQVRLVRCTNSDREMLNEIECQGKDKPPSRRACDGLPQCNLTLFYLKKVADRGRFRWKTEAWGKCSATCGEGLQKRNVTCVDSRDVITSNESCANKKKPETARICTSHCGRWKQSRWSKCSSMCGKGFQTRNVSCADVNDEPLGDIMCSSNTKPKMIRECLEYCGIWRHSRWTKCSSNCGRGTQRRQVKCFNRKFRAIDDESCDPLLRPSNIRQCSNYLCRPAIKQKPIVNRRWKTGTWTKCSRSCGRGFRRRSVQCFDGLSGKKLREQYCNKKTKPQSMNRCSLGTCPIWRVSQWSKCSKTCGTGSKQRRVSCIYGISRANHSLKTNCDESIKPPMVMSCSTNDCPKWRTSQWTKCSKTCGLGAVLRRVYCSNSTHIMPDRYCYRKLRPSSMKTCYTKSCRPMVRWAKSKWHPCSVQCGEGLKKREVWCQDFYGRKVPSIRCRNLRRKPRSQKPCRRRSCGIWETGIWGKCSKMCGLGISERDVRCRRDTLFLDERFCSNREKPRNKRSCMIKECHSRNTSYKWFAFSFSPCSKTCDAGVQSRMIVCVDQSKKQAPSELCDPHDKPAQMRACRNVNCAPKWIVGQWSECTKSCGDGRQSRVITCPEKDRNSNDLCDSSQRPPTERRCNRGSCDSFYVWKTGPWSQCSSTCGEAYMRRAVKCLGRNNQKSTDERCRKSWTVKPEDTRKCFLPKCAPRSCRDVQIQQGKQDDAEFNITINSKRIQVYCYGMLTDNPKEFITLRSGPRHNFAEYYHRSLRNPAKCPYNGARRDDCPHCVPGLLDESGGTYFSKVRLDLRRMSVIGKDFTFAVKRGKRAPNYGTAGDCYSKSQCPQGRFSIDLTNTGISISPEVTWKSYGYYLSKVISINKGRQIVTGMCGGYCGVCRPFQTLRVVVL
ncbi:A disintegrin and metalloproteinase with thrombospondin motifs 9-like [Xenia sp. Carnegie-2017]|uniref:A disintegrin and metalloproteinase with thrombospondin motifs 9-like n=1 Tax=Xenia sp. Carnegie-2017 TaxID=2897299 RepID=UPI001F046734|nr:A disintegrin and metalloproteinase with thrombospondin motifs 9-like [Xenia sp. Carnegie-2017]XP_046840032.1 A disintegrin and metalloproteinase with thrombospondin motifs 9-like [Xenia sp. Carnegie-2017]XP_046840033.1 A disintegrin and metalloproteinase with thrombospondin motifs 9-like [Xenia sp. Carnegie-2017]XP_046840034.1 A disintegrin and metalloproteinase with thrombospondin motifs 9-like [Xenia sp. Carnegie-2017]XP_046840035.1 A disintegrin and metalloproteinase with thrombospondin 